MTTLATEDIPSIPSIRILQHVVAAKTRFSTPIGVTRKPAETRPKNADPLRITSYERFELYVVHN